MNSSPGDFIVYEAPLAGPGSYNNEATIGLGFNFPIDVHCDSPEIESIMGLGLYIDSIMDTMEDISFSSSSDDAPMSSPPLLGTRRSPRRPAPASPWAEFLPMRTPSPSLRAWTANITLNLPAPAVPSLPSTPDASVGPVYGLGLDLPALNDAELVMHGHGPAPVGLGLGLPSFDDDDLIAVAAAPRAARMYAPAGGGLGLGLGLPGFDSEERIATNVVDDIDSPSPVGLGLGLSSFNEDDLIAVGAARMYHPADGGLGLGLGLPGFDSEERIATNVVDDVESPSPVLAPVPAPMRPRLRRSLHGPSIDDENVSTPSSPAPAPAYAAPVFHAPRVQPRPLPPIPSSRATVGLGLCDEDGELMHLGGENTIAQSPLSGLNSPFWGTYASSVTEEERIAAQLRKRLLSRLPIVEEVIYETSNDS